MQELLPYGRQTIEEDDISAVVSALRADLLTTGPLVDDFERAFAAATGAAHAVAVNSGTAALHMAAIVAGLGPGDLAIVPAMTFVATANVVRMTGAEVILADVDQDTGLMTASTFQAAIESAPGKVRAAFPVHLNGRLCEMAKLKEIADACGIGLIEDACHALGAPSVGAAINSKCACFSTHPVKAITTGEGGIVTTASEQLAIHLRKIRTHGITRNPAEFAERELAFDGNMPNPWYYEMQELGWNYRIPDVLCALGISQLKKLDRFYARRRAIAAYYDQLIAPLAPLIQPAPRGLDEHGLHLYVALIDFKALRATRAEVMTDLRKQNIATQVHYIPVHRHPYYKNRCGKLSLPGADRYYSRCLSLPIFPTMSDADVEHVAGALTQLAHTRS